MKARLILLSLGIASLVALSSSCGSGTSGAGGGTTSTAATTAGSGTGTTTHTVPKTDGGMGGSDTCTSHGGW